MRNIGEIYSFNNGDYELIEDNIVKESKKKSFINLFQNTPTSIEDKWGMNGNFFKRKTLQSI